MTASVHARGIVIAGALAALALALGFATLAMNQSTSRASVHTVLSLKQRHAKGHVAGASTTSVAKKGTALKRAAPKPDRNFVAALNAGLPRSVAHALATRRVVVVELTSNGDTVAKLASGEARTGAVLAGASFVRVDVDSDGGDVEVMAKLLGRLPVAPATLVYARPATLYVTLTGFNDRTTVQQAAANAAVSTQTSSATTQAAAAAAPAAVPAGAG